MLNFKNICKSYGQKKILDNVSVQAEKGSITVFLGTSGVGKSTLLRLLCGLEKVDSGTISLDNKPLTPELITKHHAVGMVFQHFNLFPHMNVETNITFPLEKVLGMTNIQAKKIAVDLLSKYNLLDKANHSIDDLSGGQKQRLALARTMALKPKVVCLDEPTSALDPLLTTYVAQIIQELAKDGYTVVIATHDTLLLEKLSCTIHLMKSGKIIETAQSNEFKKFPEKTPLLESFISGRI